MKRVVGVAIDAQERRLALVTLRRGAIVVSHTACVRREYAAALADWRTQAAGPSRLAPQLCLSAPAYHLRRYDLPARRGLARRLVRFVAGDMQDTLGTPEENSLAIDAQPLDGDAGVLSALAVATDARSLAPELETLEQAGLPIEGITCDVAAWHDALCMLLVEPPPSWVALVLERGAVIGLVSRGGRLQHAATLPCDADRGQETLRLAGAQMTLALSGHVDGTSALFLAGTLAENPAACGVLTAVESGGGGEVLRRLNLAAHKRADLRRGMIVVLEAPIRPDVAGRHRSAIRHGVLARCAAAGADG